MNKEENWSFEKEFNKYVYWLGNYIPKHMQQEAREFLLHHCKEEYIKYIIKTKNSYTWDNAIEILKEIGYPRNKNAAENIMHLFQDINWPCADVAYSVIEEIYTHEPRIVIDAIETTVEIANKYDDTSWLYGLSLVKEKLGISKNDFKKGETIKCLYRGEYWDSFDEIT